MKTLQEFTIVFDQDAMISALAASLARQRTELEEVCACCSCSGVSSRVPVSSFPDAGSNPATRTRQPG